MNKLAKFIGLNVHKDTIAIAYREGGSGCEPDRGGGSRGRSWIQTGCWTGSAARFLALFLLAVECQAKAGLHARVSG